MKKTTTKTKTKTAKTTKKTKKVQRIAAENMPTGLVALREDVENMHPGLGVDMMYYDDDVLETDPAVIEAMLESYDLPRSVLVDIDDEDENGHPTGGTVKALEMACFFAVNPDTCSIDYTAKEVPDDVPFAALVYIPSTEVMDYIIDEPELAKQPAMSEVVKYIRKLAKAAGVVK